MLKAATTRTAQGGREWRLTATQRGYNKRWTRAAALYRSQHPVCVMCERDGRVSPAECVDHIIPHKGDQELFWNERNWQGLCWVCHSQKTASEQGR
jgi:5-methylcytosine-specific restriction protein A